MVGGAGGGEVSLLHSSVCGPTRDVFVQHVCNMLMKPLLESHRLLHLQHRNLCASPVVLLVVSLVVLLVALRIVSLARAPTHGKNKCRRTFVRAGLRPNQSEGKNSTLKSIIHDGFKVQINDI